MLARLCAVYDDPLAEAARAVNEGRAPLLTVGFDIDRVQLAEAGFQPVRIGARPGPTPRADAIMGDAAMTVRGRRLLEVLLAAPAELPVVLSHCDAEQPQIFAALRELFRLGEAPARAVHFLDRAHLDRPSSARYTAHRQQQLLDWLGGLPGGVSSPARLDAAAVHAALDRLDSLRKAGAMPGSDFLAAVAAAATLPGEAFVTAAGAMADEAAAGGIQQGLRLFLAGSPHESPEFYRAIEACGAQVVGEDHAWGQRFRLAGITPPRCEAPAVVAARIATLAMQASAEAVLHLSLAGDEAAPWDTRRIADSLPAGLRFAALRAPAEPDERFRAELQAFLAAAAPAEPSSAPPTRAPRPSPRAQGSRSRKSLASVADFGAYQREWFAGIRQQVEDGAPFALVNANAPQEILRAFDIPFVVNQWWASIVAAKQQTRRYQQLLRENGFPADVEAYSAQGLAARFDEDAEQAPWGGLPCPNLLFAVASSDPTLKIFDVWAEEAGAECFVYERTVDPRPELYSDWWERLPCGWQDALEAARIDLMVRELETVIGMLERATGRAFDKARFVEIMDLVNEQEDYYRRTRDLVAATIPAPIGVVDSMPATMVPQWHRGTVWARDAAKAFYEEVRERVEGGLGAVENEQVRLMWVGRGLWSEMSFYQKWERSHGAVFVWSMYLALAADGYIRAMPPGCDPLRALASRFLTMGDELRMPTWAGPWHVHEARSHRVDAAIALQDADPFVVRALRAAGIPVLEIEADNFNREGEDVAAIEAAIGAFIEGPASARAEMRRAAA